LRHLQAREFIVDAVARKPLAGPADVIWHEADGLVREMGIERSG
jgi:hypothetical protein